MASACTACHGTNGHSHGKIPGLAGMNEARFIEQMKDFQAGDNDSTIMNRIAPGYDAKQIAVLARYFSAQTNDPPPDDAHDR